MHIRPDEETLGHREGLRGRRALPGRHRRVQRRRRTVPQGRPDTDERFAKSLESGDSNAAEQWRLAHSDSGLYLRRLAELRARNVDLVKRVDSVQSALARTGRWEESYEWRIATDGTESIEVLPGRGFRAVAAHHGTFVAEFASFAETYEALDVLSKLQKDLF